MLKSCTRGFYALLFCLSFAVMGCPGDDVDVNITDPDAGTTADVIDGDGDGDEDAAGSDAGEDADTGPQCDENQELCDGTCIDPMTDHGHCGICDNDCGSDICSDGECVLDCPVGEEACNGGCVDLLESDDHCGTCGEACEDPLSCVEGGCTLVCDSHN